MAFKFDNIAVKGSQSNKGLVPQLFTYKTEDLKATVIASGYFNNYADALSVGDIIMVSIGTASAVSAATIIAVAGISAGVVTTVVAA